MRIIMIYLDHASTTRVSDAAFHAMLPYLRELYGNPGSMHHQGVQMKKAIRLSRMQIAEAIGASGEEIIFTSGGTESDNLALVGVIDAARREKTLKHCHIITTQIEHHAILHPLSILEKNGVEVTYLSPRISEGAYAEGVIDVKQVRGAIRPDTVLISVMMANNEIGSLQQVSQIGKLAREKNILFHTDAVAVVGHKQFCVKEMNVDLLSASAHKFGGPQGCGFLYVRKNIPFSPLMYGGGQERGLRPGTPNVAGIVSMAAALTESLRDVESKQERVAMLRDKLADGLSKIPGSRINGVYDSTMRLEGNLNMSFELVQSESLLMMLDQRQICVSAGSACTASENKGSHVLKSLGYLDTQAEGTIRFSLGAENTDNEIAQTIQAVTECVNELRSIRLKEFS